MNGSAYTKIKTPCVLVFGIDCPDVWGLVTTLLLLLLLTAGLTVHLAVLAGAAAAGTTTTALLEEMRTTVSYFGHVSVSGGEYYTAARVLQVGQVW